LHVLFLELDADLDDPVPGKLIGVSEQVEEDLLQAVVVRINHLRHLFVNKDFQHIFAQGGILLDDLRHFSD